MSWRLQILPPIGLDHNLPLSHAFYIPLTTTINGPVLANQNITRTKSTSFPRNCSYLCAWSVGQTGGTPPVNVVEMSNHTIGGGGGLTAVGRISSTSSSSSSWVTAASVSISGKRIQREMAELNMDPPPDCSAGPMGDNPYHWVSTFIGPSGTPYQGGIFFLDMTFPNEYPFRPPKVVFKTRIYHCNVDSAGNLSLDILKDGWSPALTITKVLLAIRSIFSHPDPYNPLVPAVAHLYLADRPKHDELAAEWTQRFAK